MAYTGSLNDKYYKGTGLSVGATPELAQQNVKNSLASQNRINTIQAQNAQTLANNATASAAANAANASKARIASANKVANSLASSAAQGATNGNMLGAYNTLLQSYAQQQANALAARREAAQNAYNRGMSTLNDAYNTKVNSLRSNYDSTIGQLQNDFNLSSSNINNDAERALREAYTNKMLSSKNLQQQLAAQGISGGASESTMAGLLNNYGNARNKIETTKAGNLASLENQYNSNRSNALQALNSALANAESERMGYQMQLENALANLENSAVNSYANAFGDSGSYMSALKNALESMAQYEYTPTEAANGVDYVNTMQANSNVNPNNYPSYLAQLQAANDNAANALAYGDNMANAGYLQALLRQIYGGN